MRGVDPICQHVVDLELQLLNPDVRRDSAAVLELLHPDFTEIGASGRVWTREGVFEAIAGDDQLTVASDMSACQVTSGVVLLTYRADRPQRSTRRSSVWIRSEGGRWLLRFHQGTITRG